MRLEKATNPKKDEASLTAPSGGSNPNYTTSSITVCYVYKAAVIYKAD